MAKVTMPQLGESVAEGTIGKWLKKPGDPVAKYEPLVEVITDKVNAEVPSPYAGILREILVEEGATVPNNAEIAVIETTEEVGATTASSAGAAPAAVVGAPTAAAPTAPTAPAATPGPAAAAPTPAAASVPAMPASPPVPSAQAPAAAPPPPAAGPAFGPAGSDERGPEEMAGPEARMTPAVRRLLREHGLTAAQIVGTGLGGRISREDVINYVESVRTGRSVGGQVVGRTSAPAAPAATAPAPAAPAARPAPAPAAPAPTAHPAPAGERIEFPPGADEVLVPLTQMRKGIAAQMTRALAVPHAYVQLEVDATNLVRLRESLKRDYQAREGVSLSYVPFVVKAAVEALRRHPTFNAHWTEQGLLAKRRINVGVAVAVEGGLVVPVIRDVDQLSINGLNHAIADVSARARANKFRVDDFGGSTFTVDNTGWLGSNMTMPIINVPEVAIMTMEQIRKRPVVIETTDGDVIAIRPIMNMVLAIDHRANDGAGATAFLRDVRAWLEAVGPDTAIF